MTKIVTVYEVFEDRRFADDDLVSVTGDASEAAEQSRAGRAVKAETVEVPA